MSSLRNFHEGEAAIQAEAGVDTEDFDRRVGAAFMPMLEAKEIEFVESRTFSVATSVDTEGRPWTSPLFGVAGELFAVESPTVVRIAPPPDNGDPLSTNVAETGQLGVLYFDPSRRRRAKSLGTATVTEDGALRYEMTRNFGLCPKYIFKRSHTPSDQSTTATDVSAETSPQLSERDQQQFLAADTIFVGSFHDGHGADATHRGGPPGFVEIVDARTLRIPDYAGNGMFNTLGNLQLDPRISLLSVDFETGRALHTTGTASIERTPNDPMAARWVIVDVESVIATTAHAGTWDDIEPFDIRPGLLNPLTPRT